MKEETNNFMTSLESLIENNIKGIFHPTSPSLIYYDALVESSNNDKNVIPYGDELVDSRPKIVDKAYPEALDNYIGAEIVLAGKDAIPVLAKFNKRIRDANNFPIGDDNSNATLDTLMYELKFPYVRIK